VSLRLWKKYKLVLRQRDRELNRCGSAMTEGELYRPSSPVKAFRGDFSLPFPTENIGGGRSDRDVAEARKGSSYAKTLHLADTIGGRKRVQENPPPGTSPKAYRISG